MIVSTALMCLALNVYHEARSEPIMEQYAVALVTRNRAEGDNKRICQEVFKPKQFSWANKYVRKVKRGWEVPKRLMPKDQHAWWVANRIALMTISGSMADFTHGATHYHAKWINPAWSAGQTIVRRRDAHVFYRIPKSSVKEQVS